MYNRDVQELHHLQTNPAASATNDSVSVSRLNEHSLGRSHKIDINNNKSTIICVIFYEDLQGS